MNATHGNESERANDNYSKCKKITEDQKVIWLQLVEASEALIV